MLFGLSSRRRSDLDGLLYCVKQVWLSKKHALHKQEKCYFEETKCIYSYRVSILTDRASLMLDELEWKTVAILVYIDVIFGSKSLHPFTLFSMLDKK